MNATLTTNNSSSDIQSESFIPNERENYMAFGSVVKSETIEESETLDYIE